MERREPASRAVAEIELLVCCARRSLDPPWASRLSRLLDASLDWDEICRLARYHRLGRLLDRHLEAHAGRVPSAVRLALRYGAAAVSRGAEQAGRDLARLAAAFAQRAVPVIAYKGLVLSELYGDTASRDFVDLDLLVAAGDRVRAHDLLETLGYRRTRGYPWEATYRLPGSEIPLDLHWGLAPARFGACPGLDQLWPRRRKGVAGAFVPCPEDLLLVLCIQAAKDAWSRPADPPCLLKLCDLVELSRMEPGLDWRSVLERARAAGCLRIVAFASLLAHRVLDPEGAPSGLRGLPRPLLEVVGPLVADVEARLWAAGPDDHRPASPARFHAGVRERVRDRLAPYLENLRALCKPPLLQRGLRTLQTHGRATGHHLLARLRDHVN
ncbi:MAG: nucleotidyltransferase family protein [Vicinamibacteria bacterium]|nr:nucleotidyltransferase family protein [Vicinamibacteria bacterium]